MTLVILVTSQWRSDDVNDIVDVIRTLHPLHIFRCNANNRSSKSQQYLFFKQMPENSVSEYPCHLLNAYSAITGKYTCIYNTKMQEKQTRWLFLPHKVTIFQDL